VSEVAALSAASGSVRPAEHEPLASGGFESTGTTAADAATTSQAPASDRGPAGDEEDAAAFEITVPTYPQLEPFAITHPEVTESITTPTWAPPQPIEPATPRSVARIADLRGGRVAYGGNDGRVFSLWRVGKPGYGSIIEMSDDHSVMTVTFGNGRRESTLIVAWTETGLEAVEIEGGS